MGVIRVPGIGNVKIAGDQPSLDESRRIAGELGRRIDMSGIEGVTSDPRQPPSAKELAQLEQQAAPMDAPVPESKPFLVGRTIRGRDIMASPPRDGQRGDLLYDAEGNIIGYRRLSDYGYVVDPRIMMERDDDRGIQWQMYQNRLGRRVMSEPFKLPPRVLDPDARDRFDTAPGFTKAAATAREDLARERAAALGTTAELLGATAGSFAGLGIKGAGLISSALRLGVSSAGAGIGGGLGRGAAQAMGMSAENKPVTWEAITQAVQSGFTDNALGNLMVGGFFEAGRPIANGIVRFFGRLARAASPEAAVVAANARNLPNPNPVSAAEINAPFTSLYTNVAGRFPLISGIFREADQVRTLAAQTSRDLLLDSIAPAMKDTALSRQLVKQANATYDARRTLIESIYKNADAQIKSQPGLADVGAYSLNRISRLVSDLKQEFGTKFRNLPPEIRPKDAQQIITGVNEVDDILKRYAKIGREVSYNEMKAIIDEASQRLRSFESLESKGITNTILGRFEESFVNTLSRPNASTWKILSPVQRDAFVDAYKNLKLAKKEWSDMHLLTESTAGRPFLLADKNLFKAGFAKPGTREFDEMSKTISESPKLLESPQFVQNMRELTSSDVVHQLLRRRLETMFRGQADTVPAELNAFTQAEFNTARRGRDLLKPGQTEVTLASPGEIRKNLRLDDPNSIQYQALAEGLKGTSVTPKQIDEVLKRIEINQRIPVPDPATMLARRVTLGGTGALLGGILIGAGASGGLEEGTGLGIGGSLALIIGGRAMAKLLTTQRGLATMRGGITPNLSREEALKFMVRLNRIEPSIIPTDEDGMPLTDAQGRVTLRSLRDHLQVPEGRKLDPVVGEPFDIQRSLEQRSRQEFR